VDSAEQKPKDYDTTGTGNEFAPQSSVVLYSFSPSTIRNWKLDN